MTPTYDKGNVRADCPDCGVPTTFEVRGGSASSPFGSVVVDERHDHDDKAFQRIVFRLLRCTVCSGPGVAKVHFNQDADGSDAQMEWFWSSAVVPVRIPAGVPDGVVKEFREAELCLSVKAWRAAAALFRSALEKALRANGYNTPTERDLYKKIEAAAKDGVITAARRQRAQALVRTLGNDVLHDDWREVSQTEAEAAQHYVGRVMEDLYDDRPSVLETLRLAGRAI